LASSPSTAKLVTLSVCPFERKAAERGVGGQQALARAQHPQSDPPHRQGAKAVAIPAAPHLHVAI
jgi:hypothetical protein